MMFDIWTCHHTCMIQFFLTTLSYFVLPAYILSNAFKAKLDQMKQLKQPIGREKLRHCSENFDVLM